MRLSQPQQRTRQRIEQLATRDLAPPELGRRLMQALAEALPNDGFRLFGVDPGTLLVNRLLAASDDDVWARDEWLRDIYLAADPLTYIELPNLMRLGLNAVAAHERQSESWGYPQPVLALLTEREHYLAFHELRSPVGGTLFGCFQADGRWLAAAQLYRRDRARPYLRTDVAFLRLIAPIIGRALASAFARERAMLDAPERGAATSGIVILDAHGNVDFSTPTGDDWLRLLLERDGNRALPTALWAAVARSRTAADGAGVLLAPTSAGTVRIEVSASGPDGRLAVVVAPRQPPALPAIPDGWQLTPQEARVTELILRGSSNRDIAAALVVSENTVQTHLRHIYEKVSVRSRTQLLARYFREQRFGDMEQ